MPRMCLQDITCTLGCALRALIPEACRIGGPQAGCTWVACFSQPMCQGISWKLPCLSGTWAPCQGGHSWGCMLSYLLLLLHGNLIVLPGVVADLVNWIIPVWLVLLQEVWQHLFIKVIDKASLSWNPVNCMLAFSQVDTQKCSSLRLID